MSIITISRGTMSGGEKIAEKLSKKIGYKCIGREIVIKAAKDYGAPENKLYESIQKGPSFFQKFTCERERYLAFIQASLCEFAKDDNIIYHGHAGHFLLEGISHVLRVRISANMNYRIKAAMENFDFSEKEAIKYIKMVDKQRIKWTKFLYGEDWRSPELYDIVINLDRGDIDLACDIIKLTVEQKQFQPTEKSRQNMYNLLISSRVRAAIASLPYTCLEYLQVKADQGVVSISGRAASEKSMKKIIAAAGRAKGVERIDNQIDIDCHICEIG